MAFALPPPPSDLRGGVEAVKGLLGHKHIAFNALGEGVGYPHPGLQVFHKRGGVQNGSGSWSGLSPYPDIPQSGIKLLPTSSVRRLNSYGPPWG